MGAFKFMIISARIFDWHMDLCELELQTIIIRENLTVNLCDILPTRPTFCEYTTVEEYTRDIGQWCSAAVSNLEARMVWERSVTSQL